MVFSLTGWSPLLPSRFHVSRCTLDPALLTPISRTGFSPSLIGLSSAVLLISSVTSTVLTPECTHSGLGSSGFARRYSRNHCCFLFLRLLRCFSSPGSPRMVMDSPYGDWQRQPGFPIQISADRCVFATPRSFSQLITSFIGS